MGLDIIVDTYPEQIIHLGQEEAINKVDEILSKIDRYGKEMDCEAGVIRVQNKHLGGSCRVVCEKEAINGIDSPRTSEWYVEPFYPRFYFAELRERLSGQEDYS